MTEVYLGLGSNLGLRQVNLALALELLGGRGVRVEAVSSVCETEPVGYARQPWFLNMACRASTELAPDALLRTLKGVERALGRGESAPGLPRAIDIDILLYGDLVLEGDVTVPHPRMAERAFVLAPLAELAPDLRHPVLGRTIGELLAEVAGQKGVRLWSRERPGAGTSGPEGGP